MRLATLAGLISLLITSSAHAGKIEKTFGLGLNFYSGAQSAYVVPELGPTLNFAGNILYKRINIVNHFEFAYLAGGANFGGSHGAYTGVAGTYNLSFKLNLAKETVQPYIELGPALGLFAIMLSGAPSGGSKNQTSFKYGYSIGTGFDWLRSGVRGEGNGWGVGFSYFSFMKSPAVFEFPNAALGAKGVKIEFRRIFGESR